MKVVVALSGAVGLLSMIYATMLLAAVSQKLGAMNRMKPYYRWMHLGAFFLAVAFLIRLLRTTVFWASEQAPPLLNSDFFYLASYYIPLCVGMTINLMVTIRYWGWLLRS